MDISSWMVDSAYVAARTGVNVSGDPQYGSPVLVPCRLEVGSKLFLGAGVNGANLNATHWITTESLINPDDRVWFPSLGDTPGDAGSARRPLSNKNAATKDTGYRIYETFFAG